jgi:1-acyl-sn-glycerol-3-phosphate acyltransferase
MFPPDLPPASNRFLYIYRVLAKLFSFFFFGLITILLLSLIFPPMRLFIHPKERFKKYGRRFISSSLSFFIRFTCILGIVKLESVSRELFRNIHSKIIAANHPSILDVIILFSLIPNADCIVNAYLDSSIVGGVVRQLYILNSLDFDEMLKRCNESLKQGNCLIIFPEGTRTPRHGKTKLKKGAARIAVSSGCGILPVRIGGTDKYGLGKKDPWTGVNPLGPYVYEISTGAEFKPEKYQGLPAPIAVKKLTEDLHAALFPERKTCESIAE